MNSLLLYISNFIVEVLPSSRFFALKRFLYKIAGVEMGKNVRLMNIRILKTGKLIVGDNTFIGNNTFLTGGGGSDNYRV